MSGKKTSNLQFILVRLGIVAVIIVLLYLALAGGMRMLNRLVGVAPDDDKAHEGTDDFPIPEDSLWMPAGEIAPAEHEPPHQSLEYGWELTLCSLFMDGHSGPLLDSLPTAPSVRDKPFEALLLVRKWAAEAGAHDDDLRNIHVFTKRDTIYIDLPTMMDINGLRRTIEGRFICFTRMFPMVAGNLLTGFPTGIPLRGVEGVFR